MVLPYINMNPPQVYTCSPSWTLFPPPSPYHPSGLSQWFVLNPDWSVWNMSFLYLDQPWWKLDVRQSVIGITRTHQFCLMTMPLTSCKFLKFSSSINPQSWAAALSGEWTPSSVLWACLPPVEWLLPGAPSCFPRGPWPAAPLGAASVQVGTRSLRSVS